MDNGDVFRVCACNCIDRRELADTECGDESGNTLYTSVAICCVTCIELIAVADPLQAGFGNVVESNKVVVAGNTVDGLDANFLEASE